MDWEGAIVFYLCEMVYLFFGGYKLEDWLVKVLLFFAFARLSDFSGGLYNSSKSHFADYRIEM